MVKQKINGAQCISTHNSQQAVTVCKYSTPGAHLSAGAGARSVRLPASAAYAWLPRALLPHYFYHALLQFGHLFFLLLTFYRAHPPPAPRLTKIYRRACMPRAAFSHFPFFASYWTKVIFRFILFFYSLTHAIKITRKNCYEKYSKKSEIK